MKIDVQFENELPISESRIKNIGKAVLQEEKIRFNGILSVALVTDNTIRDVNRRFLNIDAPTDVIAFPYDDTADNNEEIWGEIYVSTERAADQAKTYHVDYLEELSRLIIHGLLHLAGYRDHTAALKASMHAREDYYLDQLQLRQEEK